MSRRTREATRVYVDLIQLILVQGSFIKSTDSISTLLLRILAVVRLLIVGFVHFKSIYVL